MIILIQTKRVLKDIHNAAVVKFGPPRRQSKENHFPWIPDYYYLLNQHTKKLYDFLFAFIANQEDP